MKATHGAGFFENVVPFPGPRCGNVLDRHWARHIADEAAERDVCERTVPERVCEALAIVLFAMVCAGNVALILTVLGARLQF